MAEIVLLTIKNRHAIGIGKFTIVIRPTGTPNRPKCDVKG